MYFEWQNHHPVTLRCVDKLWETRDTVSLILSDLTENAIFDYKAGQFINLGVEIDGQLAFRAYSLSSLAGDDTLQLTIKRVEGGLVSNHLIDTLKIGDTVQALPPTGNFNCIDHPPIEINGRRKALLISAGCGITPVYAMARHWLYHEEDIDITFLHIARSPQETIYYDVLEAYHSQFDEFDLKLLLKHRGESTHAQGRLDEQWLAHLVPDLLERTVYLCGPNGFMQDTRHYLELLGFDMSRFFQESFTPTEHKTECDDLASGQTVTSQPTSASHQLKTEAEDQSRLTVTLPAFAQSLDTQEGQLLADIMEEAGVPLILACRSGICGSCKCKVTAGKVQSTSHETLTPEEVDYGYVLACSSTVTEDVCIEIG